MTLVSIITLQAHNIKLQLQGSSRFLRLDMPMDNQSHEYRAFLERMSEIDLMVRVILLNPVPISEHPDILKNLKILNYVLGEWNDEYDRMQLI